MLSGALLRRKLGPDTEPIRLLDLIGMRSCYAGHSLANAPAVGTLVVECDCPLEYATFLSS